MARMGRDVFSSEGLEERQRGSGQILVYFEGPKTLLVTLLYLYLYDKI